MDDAVDTWSPLLGDLAHVKTTGEVGEVVRFEGSGTSRKYVVQVYSEATGQGAERTCSLTDLERG
jgi:hypothetical protein